MYIKQVVHCINMTGCYGVAWLITRCCS